MLYGIVHKKHITYVSFIQIPFQNILTYIYYRKFCIFYGWGIHLYTGKFGSGKTSVMTVKALELCEKYPQLHVLTNYTLSNFPDHTDIIKLRSAEDILNAPKNTIVLIDEIGTIFNSRDFSSGKRSVPKPVFQHLCQCRHRNMMILGTVQRFNLLDKQIRDITATVTECHTTLKHPFARKFTALCYDIEEYEAYTANKLYKPLPFDSFLYIQTERYHLPFHQYHINGGISPSEYIRTNQTVKACKAY